MGQYSNVNHHIYLQPLKSAIYPNYFKMVHILHQMLFISPISSYWVLANWWFWFHYLIDEKLFILFSVVIVLIYWCGNPSNAHNFPLKCCSLLNVTGASGYLCSSRVTARNHKSFWKTTACQSRVRYKTWCGILFVLLSAPLSSIGICSV